VNDIIYICRDLSADHSSDKPHQALGLTQVATPDGLHDDEEGIMNFVIELLGA
jgi:hypothetical protein